MVNSSDGEEGEYFEGDIILTPDQVLALQEQRNQHNSFASINANHWKTNGRPNEIKYFIQKELANEIRARNAINNAIEEYRRYTCLSFKEVLVKPIKEPHLHFIWGNGCFSSVGRMRFGNRISLGSGCWYTGTAIHEIGHSLGFFHEQSRPDRDQYVEIMWNNIKEKNKHNFVKYTTSGINSLNTTYDFESIMHYKFNAFGISKSKPTIRTRDPSKQYLIGKRKNLSKIDKIQLNRLYCGGDKPSGTPYPTTTTTAAPKHCEDFLSGCPTWKSSCNTREHTKKYCLKTCNLCHVTPCQDERTDCSKLKQYCTTHMVVKRGCFKTCGKCD